MLAIAGGVLIAFFVIRFVVALGAGWEGYKHDEHVAERMAAYDEDKRLSALGARIQARVPWLYEEARTRLQPPEAKPNEQYNVVHPKTREVRTVWGQELAQYPEWIRASAGSLADLGRAAEAICRERNLPHPDNIGPDTAIPSMPRANEARARERS